MHKSFYFISRRVESIFNKQPVPVKIFLFLVIILPLFVASITKPINVIAASTNFFPVDENTLAIFEFNGNVQDSSGNNRHATLLNASSTYSTSTFGQGLVLPNQSNVYQGIQWNAYKSLLVAPYTVEVLVFPEDVEDYARLFTHDTLDDDGLYYYQGTLINYPDDGLSGVSLASSTLHCLAWAAPASPANKLNLYLDGDYLGQVNRAYDEPSIAHFFMDNTENAPNENILGYVDAMRISNVVRTNAELASVCAASNAGESLLDLPRVNSLSPSDNATGVSLTPSLIATFSTSTLATSTGSIGLYKTSDNSLIESFSVNSSLIGRSATAASTTFTISPSVTLVENTGYYISIPATFFKDAADKFYLGTPASTTWNFTTVDLTAPIITSVSASSITNSAASISWTTNEIASSRVVYGPSTAYGSSTSETDTAPRVTSHTVSLAQLLPCTLYHYAVVSSDSGGNSATSTDNNFITTGCEAGGTPSAATSTQITSVSGGSSSITTGIKTFTVTAPINATATSSSFVIQVKTIPSSPVLSSVGTPSSKPTVVGTTVFDVKAIIDGDTELDSFDAEVTIAYEYSEGEIADLDESSLWLYHYTGGDWVALNNCVLDTGANTISCTTPSFSIFGLFGSEAAVVSAVSSGGTSGTAFGCNDPGANNFKKSVRHKQSLCKYDEVETVTSQSICSPYIKSYIRINGNNNSDDVRKLETFLNDKQDETLPIDGIYSMEDMEAVKRFQKKYQSEVLSVWGLSEPTGYVYRTTLIKINSFYCNQNLTCPAFTEHNSLEENSISEENLKTKTLLSELGFYSGAVNDVFDLELDTALKNFQETFSDTMLKPWNLTYGTGYKYKTTNKFLNLIVGCKTEAVELDGLGVFNY